MHRTHTGDLRAATEALLHAGDIEEAAALLTTEPGCQLDDASLRLDVAEALRQHGHAREAIAVLSVQVGLYVDRKPKERSVVHLELARDWLSADDPAQSLQQLDFAIGIDPTNADILAMHGKLALELGVLASAEQSYRSLLLLAMHQSQGAAQGNLPALAVLYFRLAQIAERRGDRDRADELIASAFDAAMNEESQTRELEQALIEARADDLLLKTLDSQLGRAGGVEQSASVLMDFATRRLRLGEPSVQLLSRLRDRADQISGILSNEGNAEVVLRAHCPLVAVYRLLGDTECVLALLLTWASRFGSVSVGRALEVEAAKLMLDFPERRAEGIEALLSAWSRDSSREDVAEVLGSALVAEGRLEDLAVLVTDRIAKAERKRNTDQANALRLELGELYERTGKKDGSGRGLRIRRDGNNDAQASRNRSPWSRSFDHWRRSSATLSGARGATRAVGGESGRRNGAQASSAAQGRGGINRQAVRFYRFGTRAQSRVCSRPKLRTASRSVGGLVS